MERLWREGLHVHPVRGPVETAQRVEARAFVAAVECTAGAVKVWSDSRYVCRGMP